MTFNITAPLTPATPFFAGQNATFTSVPLNAVALQDRVYAIDLKEYRHVGLPPFREGVVASNEPSDLLFNPNGGWWRYRYDWSLGMGQSIADLDDDVLGKRYDYSEGLDPWSTNQLSLQNALTSAHEFDTTLDVVKPIFFKWTDGTREYLVVSNNSESVYIDKDGVVTSWYTSGVRAFGLPDLGSFPNRSTNDWVSHVASSGNNFYSYAWFDFSSQFVIFTCSLQWNGGLNDLETSVSAYNFVGAKNSTLFQIVGNSLLVGIENNLYEFIPGSGLDLLYTHPDSTFIWTTAFNIGSRIYVGGYGVEQSNVFSFTTTSTGKLAVSSQATVFPNDEKLYGAFGYGGNAIIWSNRGIRFATVGGDNSLTYGKLIAPGGPITCAYPYQKHIWFNWVREDGQLQLGRLSLEDFTDSLTPAYATDVVSSAIADASGVYMAVFVDAAATVLNGYPTYTSPTLYVYGTNNVLYKKTDTFVSDGYFTSGELYFGTAENKSLGRVEVRFDALKANESVTCEIIDSETQQVIGFRTVGIPGEKTLSVTSQGYTFNRAYLKLTLESDGTSTPVIRQWKISAYPVAPATQQWTIALIIGQVVLVGSGEGQLVSYDPWAEIEYVRDLWRSRQVFTYTEGTHSYRARVENFSVEPIKWDDSGEWLEIILNVQLISVE